MSHENDTPLSDKELALAKKGEALISAAVAETQAPQSLRESIERERERAHAAPPRAPFWRRHLGALAATAAAAVAAAGIVVATNGGNESEGPSLAAVEAATRLEATGPAPAPNGGDPPVLAARVGPISFP